MSVCRISTMAFHVGLLASGLLAAPLHCVAEAPVAAFVELSSDTVYAGEVLELTISIRSHGVQIGQDFRLSGLPDRRQLERLGAFDELPVVRSQRDGIVTETRRYRLTARALTSGQLRIAPVIELTVIRRRGMNGWHALTDDREQLAVEPVELTVKPLPPLPDHMQFSGAVGLFELTVNVSPRELAVGDLIVVRSDVQGHGYLQVVNPPRIGDASGFRRYPARRIERQQGIAFEQILIPLTTNAVVVSPVTFTFFDPVAGDYVTAGSTPVELVFHPESMTTIDLYQPSPSPAGDDATARLEAAIARLRAADRGMRLKLPIRRLAHAAPGSASLPLFELPSGSRVRVLGRHTDWLMIQTGRKRGWIAIP